MKVRRYFAANMRSALEMVRQEQGPDVLILSNRKVELRIEPLEATRLRFVGHGSHHFPFLDIAPIHIFHRNELELRFPAVRHLLTHGNPPLLVDPLGALHGLSLMGRDHLPFDGGSSAYVFLAELTAGQSRDAAAGVFGQLRLRA